MMAQQSPEAEVEQTIRDLLAQALGDNVGRIASLPAETELFGPEIGLSSLAGAALLSGLQRRFGVDVADRDLNLDSLQSIATLRDFVVTNM
ncbi:acyl carrier protein [Streptomyces sp. G5(2025)]|uniref:acyl carrier protein n=1 Tax=Streptomyces sp. G5(2025) TaxID=3406628 RepID=UPI003C1D0928